LYALLFIEQKIQLITELMVARVMFFVHQWQREKIFN